MIRPNNIRMIAVDLDGTLLNEEKEITPRVMLALKAAVNRGIEIVPSTGRIVTGIPEELIRQVGIRYVLSANGANIYDVKEQRTIYSKSLNETQVLEVLQLASTENCFYDVFSGADAYASQERLEQAEAYDDSDSFLQYIMDTRQGVPDLIEFVGESRCKIEKINLFFLNQQSKEAMLHRLRQVKGISITSGLKTNIEVNAESVNKGAGISWLANRIGIKKGDIMAIGDGENDLELLAASHYPVAMKNATMGVKESACYITKSNEDDGVAYAIEQFLDIKEEEYI